MILDSLYYHDYHTYFHTMDLLKKRKTMKQTFSLGTPLTV